MTVAVALAAVLPLVPYPQQVELRAGSVPAGSVSHRTDKAIPPEGYRIEIGADGTFVWSSDASGSFYADKTLSQLADGEGRWPCCRIVDAPHFSWRAMHISTMRYSREELRRILDQLAEHKLNVLVFNVAWRIGVPGYPNLLKVIGPQDAYAEEDVKWLVDEAAKRHIGVVPTIQLLGHQKTVLGAYPELRCENLSEDFETASLCPGSDRALDFIEHAVDEACRLFPGDYIHLGGDEVDRANWRRCPRCAARVREQGLESVEDLEDWVNDRMVKRVEAKGRKAIFWDEAMRPGRLTKTATIVGWDGDAPMLQSARGGWPTIAGSFNGCYFDYSQMIPADPVYYDAYEWTQGFPLSRTYLFDPVGMAGPEGGKNFIGVQGHNWGLATLPMLEWRMWPRGCALAETAWTYAEKRDYEGFLERMDAHRRRLQRMGVNVAPHRVPVVRVRGGEFDMRNGQIVFRYAFETDSPEVAVDFLYDRPIETDAISIEVKNTGDVYQRTLVEMEETNGNLIRRVVCNSKREWVEEKCPLGRTAKLRRISVVMPKPFVVKRRIGEMAIRKLAVEGVR